MLCPGDVRWECESSSLHVASCEKEVAGMSRVQLQGVLQRELESLVGVFCSGEIGIDLAEKIAYQAMWAAVRRMRKSLPEDLRVTLDTDGHPIFKGWKPEKVGKLDLGKKVALCERCFSEPVCATRENPDRGICVECLDESRTS